MTHCIRMVAGLLLLLSCREMAAQDTGKLLVLRKTGPQQSARKCQLQENDAPLASLANNEAVLLELPAGTHTLQTRLKSGPVMGYTVHAQAGAYTFYELELYKVGGILPSSGYRFRLVPLSPKRLVVYLRDEDWLRRDLGQAEYDLICRMLTGEAPVGLVR